MNECMNGRGGLGDLMGVRSGNENQRRNENAKARAKSFVVVVRTFFLFVWDSLSLFCYSFPCSIDRCRSRSCWLGLWLVFWSSPGNTYIISSGWVVGFCGSCYSFCCWGGVAPPSIRSAILALVCIISYLVVVFGSIPCHTRASVPFGPLARSPSYLFVSCMYKKTPAPRMTRMTAIRPVCLPLMSSSILAAAPLAKGRAPALFIVKGD